MSESARKPVVGLKPVSPGLAVEVLDWVKALRMVWVDTGMSINRFARLHPVDKGSVSRYLRGERVPSHPWFMDTLLAIRAENGTPVAPDVRQHLTELHLCALEAKHPHEYRVRMISDQREIAQTRKQEAERYARSLEEQLTKRNHQIEELTDEQGTAAQTKRRAEQEVMNRLHNDVSRIDNEIINVELEIKLLELFRQGGSWTAYGARIRSGEEQRDAAKIAELQCKLGDLHKDHQELTKIIALYSGFDTITPCGKDIVPYSKGKDIVLYRGRTHPYDLHRWPLQIGQTTSSV